VLTWAAPIIDDARRRFYNLGGPWYRCRIFEAFGSTRYARPALFNMDRKLCQLMPWRGGTFVEAGAHDGYTQSNTYYLERHRGWSGVLVEPVPELQTLCKRRRPNSQVVGCALVGPSHGAGVVDIHFGDLMSVIGDHRDHACDGLAVAGRDGYTVGVPARTLADVLTETKLGAIDLLVLDIEGHELDVLAGLDFERHAPRYLLVEALKRELQKPALDRVLAAHYRFVEALSEYDLLYRHLSESQPAPALKESATTASSRAIA
jgi:FkbM family methyltransferase